MYLDDDKNVIRFILSMSLLTMYMVKSTISILAATALAVGMLLTAFNTEVLGQINNTSFKNAIATAPTNQKNVSSAINITGSISLRSTINGAISSKVKIPLSEAVLTAQKAVGLNSSPTSAFMRPLNGYLVYDMHVRNYSNNTLYAVIVDPGSGEVLYKQALPSLSSSAGGHPFIFGKGTAGPFVAGVYRGEMGYVCHRSDGATISGCMNNDSY